MNLDQVIFLGHNAMMVTLMASAPMLLSGMIVGLAISIFQSVTQIQEITLTFIPKIAVVGLVILFLIPWMWDIIIRFTLLIFDQITILGQ